MKVSELIEVLQKVEDQTMTVYKIENGGHFVELTQEDVSDIELGEACDENGTPLNLDEYPELSGLHILCINWETFNEETE